MMDLSAESVELSEAATGFVCEVQGEDTAVKGYRIALLSSYDGTDFVGFQFQNNGRSVQGVLEAALMVLYKSFVRVHGCSRTDAGVHAMGHVCHADVPFFIPAEKLPLAINQNLPEDLAVLRAAYVDGDFHARFGSCGKEYVYRIWNGPIRPVLERQYLAHVPIALDVECMRAAAVLFEGELDFSAFCAAGGKHVPPVRRLDSVRVEAVPGSEEIRIVVRGKSFLYNMVRIIAGTLVYAGLGKLSVEEIARLFEEKDRRLAGKTMPPQGLTLARVFYENGPFEV